MTLKQLIEKAVDEKNPKAALAVADHCRFQLGMNYERIFLLVSETRPGMTLAEWDALLEGEMAE